MWRRFTTTTNQNNRASRRPQIVIPARLDKHANKENRIKNAVYRNCHQMNIYFKSFASAIGLRGQVLDLQGVTLLVSYFLSSFDATYDATCYVKTEETIQRFSALCTR